MPDTLLDVRFLSKAYGNLKVLDGVSFKLRRGEVMGLVGRRGAGKSTLLKLIGGSERPSTGELSFNDRVAHFEKVSQARDLGIELVYQTPKIVSQLDVVQNIFLGREIAKSGGLPDWDQMYVQAHELVRELGLPVELLHTPVQNLSEEQRQLVSLLRAFCRPAKLLLLDDILPDLYYPYQRVILSHIKRLTQKGMSAIISSDNLKHLFKITDRILVLYQGRRVADSETNETTPRDIVELIVGTRDQDQVTPVIWALESYHAAQKQTDALFRRQAELHEDLEASDSLNQELVQRLSEQVQALDRLNAALQETQRRLLTEREEERKALARELHDQVIQDLLSVNYRLEGTEDETLSSAQQSEQAEVREGIRSVVKTLRRMCRDLRPPTLDMHGLITAIRSHAEEWSERTGISIDIQVDSSMNNLPKTTEISVFRMIQEGLNNIAKHANASNVVLGLERTASDNLVLHITDDGQGFAKPPNLADLSKKNHYGLIGISERAALLGGKMKVKSVPEGGSELQVEIPTPYPLG